MAAQGIVQADSHEEAAPLFMGHPRITIFAVDSVEIMTGPPVPSV